MSFFDGLNMTIFIVAVVKDFHKLAICMALSLFSKYCILLWQMYS